MIIPCIFGCAEAAGIFEMSKGCVCHTDRLQALCLQHIIRASPHGSMRLVVSLIPLKDMARLGPVGDALVVKFEP